jgi:predicted nucleic acid-binding protein
LRIPDTIVAAVALHHQLALVTGNTKDFPMEDLSFHVLPEA